MKEKIYIPLPRNISTSVFEALKIHVSFFEKLKKEVVYLSRSEKIIDKKIVNCKSVFQTIKLLRKEKGGKIYCITVNEVLLAVSSNFFLPKKEIIFWVQGLIDDEDFLSRRNKLRYLVFKNVFKLCLRISSKIVVVTNEMHKVLEKKYQCPKNKRYIVVPCKSRVKYNGDEKVKNSLCYIGGLSKWQNVDKILVFYNKLSHVESKYKLYIATFDHKAANNLIEKIVDKNYQSNITLVSVSLASEVEAFLSIMEYGFLIRDNIPLNNVASPIKLAEYLSCGVTPIISSSLTEFYNQLKNCDCGILIDNDINVAIEKLLLTQPSLLKVVETYRSIYEPDNFEQNLKHFLDS